MQTKLSTWKQFIRLSDHTNVILGNITQRLDWCCIKFGIDSQRSGMRAYMQAVARAGTNLWEMLPSDLQYKIWEHFSVREMARMAEVSKSFNEFAKQQRLATKTLKIPAGTSAFKISQMHHSARPLDCVTERCLCCHTYYTAVILGTTQSHLFGEFGWITRRVMAMLSACLFSTLKKCHCTSHVQPRWPDDEAK